MGSEFRDAPPSGVEDNRLVGYAARFNSPAIISGEFIETIAPGAFSYSLRTEDVLALLDHDGGRLLGRTSSETLQLREDKHGLAFDLSVAVNTPDGAAAMSLVQRRDLFGCSFGFYVVEEDWNFTDGELPRRTIIDVDLFEISIVAMPAYSSTFVTAARSKEIVRAAVPASRAEAIAARRAAMEQKFRGIPA